MKLTHCPRCDRDVQTVDDYYRNHQATTRPADGLCSLSGQMVPVSGLAPAHYEQRAQIVANLAAQVQDADPAIVWDYLTALPAAEVQRLLVLALSAIDVDQTVDEMFAWVCDLPAAKVTAA